MSTEFEEFDVMEDEEFLDERAAKVEAQFQELEQEEEIEALRARVKKEAKDDGFKEENISSKESEASKHNRKERHVLLVCPHCQGKNRTSLFRLQSNLPRCGRCKGELSFLKNQ